MKITELIQTVPGVVEVFGDDQVDIIKLCTDSRAVDMDSMFFCIPGLRFDAHDFAAQAVLSGARALVVERKLEVDCTQVLVRDVREALSYIAAQFYGNPAQKLKLIGITGTKGKTTTSFLVKSILEAAGRKTGLIGTVCSLVGDKEIPSNLTTPDPIDFQCLLAEMVLAGAEYVVMEVSAHALALKKMEGVYFQVACFLNFTQDHLDFFHTMDRYLEAKMLLFTKEKCAFAIYSADDDGVRNAFEGIDLPHTAIGIRMGADVFANDIEISERGCTYRLNFNKRYRIPIALCLSGIFNVYNSMMAAAICDQLGVDKKDIQRGLESIRNVPGRIELLDTDTPYRVILDYAHSPDALENILKTIRQTSKKRVIALFGCGGDRDHEKRPIMGEIGGKLSDYCILTSDNPRNEDPLEILNAIEAGIQETQCEYVIIENRRQAIRTALQMAEPGDVIVLAGKGHETYQEIRGVKHPFNEKVVVQELLIEMGVKPNPQCSCGK